MWLNRVAPVLQHLGDVHGELVVEGVSEDVLDPPVLKQILHETTREPGKSTSVDKNMFSF